MMKPDKDLIIIGAGPAGLSAAQYGSRANLKVQIIEELASGGQTIVIDNLENYPGFSEPVSGFAFSQKMEDQAVKFGAEIINDTVTEISKTGDLFRIKTTSGGYTAYTIIIATGSKHRTLDIPGEKEFSGKGVSYCATCDGPFFKGKKMLVVGGGDAACDESMFLSKLSDRILIIHRKEKFRAQKQLAARVLSNKNIEVRFNTELKEIKGDVSVKRVCLYNNMEKKEYEENIDAVFIFTGSLPQSKLAAACGCALDENGNIITDNFMRTNVKGIFAAGDVRNTPFRQIVVAASDGAIAAHAASSYIDELLGSEYK